MPTPNYGYEKRQRELAKKRKKEDKAAAKAAAKAGLSSPAEGDAGVDPDAGAPTPADDAAAGVSAQGEGD